MSINLELKNNIKKHIRKYMTVVCSLLLIPIFSINSYALTASFPQFNLGVTRLYCYELENWFSAGDDDVFSFSNNWNKTIDSLSLRLFASTDETDAYFSFPIIDGYDYYFYTSLGYIKGSGSSFIPSDFEIFNRIDNSILSITDKQSFKFIYDDEGVTTAVDRYAFVGKLNISDVNSFGSIRFTGNEGILLNRLFFECSVFLVPSDSGDGINDVIAAISAQTSTLGGKLDGIDSGIDKGNDLIENGNSGTESTITDFNEVFEDFNTELENIEKFDTEIIEEFESANEIYLTELNNFNLSASLINAGNWLSTSMQTIYDNSSDYKMLWLVPLLLGIPLLILFVRRGDNNE